MIEQIKGWLAINQDWVSWLVLGSAIMFVLSIIIVPILVIRMQHDYFLEDKNQDLTMKNQHPVMRILGKTLKNLAGGLLVIGGILLSLPGIPGQGLLTILIGLAVMDFTGKRKLEIWLVKRKPVIWAIQKLREKKDRPPLLLPND